MNNLMIIESPNKVKTISAFLPKNFKIISTVGHIRDLSSHGIGFDKDNLEPKWQIITTNKYGKGKKQIVSEIKKAADDADKIFLATDPDREGEAIAWHVFDVLSKEDQQKCQRITFNEITKRAVLEAINNPRQINKNYVEAQFARRILDRMVGYKLSNLVQKTMHADSAGRVQSLALRFILDRENQIRNFVKTYWWTVDPIIKNNLKLSLNKVNDNCNKEWYKSENGSIHFLKNEYAEDFKKTLNNEFTVDHVDPARLLYRSAPEPYKTSTLQQDAINTLGWSAKKITSIAQLLYEGIDVKNDHIALISYPRTDSTRYSKEFIDSTKKFIFKNYGEKYLSNKNFEITSNKNKNTIQDAHEAIRVIDVNIVPKSLEGSIGNDELKLYTLIWKHSLSSLMSNAVFEKTTIWFENNKNFFNLSHTVRVFDGWQILHSYKEEENIYFSDFVINEKIFASDILVNKHESLPPARYTQASLISELEKSGVGRPSTYSTMANIPLDRGYAEIKNRYYYVTKLGEQVANNLDKYFSDIINIKFTKDMEDRLDKITNDGENWKTWLLKFWPDLLEKSKNVHERIKEEKKSEEPEYVGELCPKCKEGQLIYRYSKKGHQKFIGCSNFPKCDYVKSLKEPPKILDRKCPKCEEGNLVERENKKHQKFIACTNYPKCKYIESTNKQKLS